MPQPESPIRTTFEVVKKDGSYMGGRATRKEVRIHFENAKGSAEMQLLVFTPNGGGKPAPAFLLHSFAGTKDDGHDAHPDKLGFTRNGLPLGEFFKRGFGFVVVPQGDLVRHNEVEFLKGAHLIVDGRRVSGTVKLEASETVAIELRSLPPTGMHLLQVQNPDGLFSNDFIFHVADDAAAAEALTRQFDADHSDLPDLLAAAIARGDLEATKRHVRQGADVNPRRREGGSTPLSAAALPGRLDIAKYLIEHGASVTATNRDGNTPLHAAAFLCRRDLVKLLIEHGASLTQRNNNRETPLDVVSGAWSDGLAGFYLFMEATADLELILQRIQAERPRMTQLLKTHTEKSQRRADRN